MPDVDHLAAFLARALGEVPGVGEVRLLVDGAHAAALPGAPLHRVELRTARRSMGALVIALDDPAAFAPYAPFVDNTGNVVALLLETRGHVAELEVKNQALREVRATLEAQVAARTAELAEKSRHFERLLQTSRDAVHVVDREGRLREHNQAFLDHLGYSAEEASSLSIWAWDARWTREEIVSHLAGLLREPRRFETTHVRKDGALREVEVECAPITVGGETLLWASARDVTEGRRSQRALRQLWRAVEEAPVSIVITDRAGDIEYVNPAFTRITGFTAEEVHGRNPRILQSGRTPRETYTQLWSALLEGREWRGEFINCTKSGEAYIEDVRMAPVLDGRGEISHFVAVKQDVTAEREAQRQLALLNAELEQRVAERTEELSRASRAKDEFLASMSHELRTPLNGILGTAEVIDAEIYGPIGEDLRRAVSRIDESGRHLLALINDILDVAKVGAGKLALEPAAVDVEALCRASLRLVEPPARRKRIGLCAGGDFDLPTIVADERRLKQVLVNLLTNAVKFTPEGGRVGLDAEVVDDGAALRFTVWDTGVGIPADDLPRLFQPFVQLDAGLARQHAGTGLGLALVRQLTELHGGRVRVESAVGVGSRFVVTLPLLPADPLTKAQAAPLGWRPAPSATPRLVLLADDEPSNIPPLRDMLQARGHDVRIATQGAEAVQMALELRPDVILMDVQMPVVDGLTATRRLRAAPETRAIPIIAVTALAMPGDRERCLAAGADEYLPKPVSVKLLVAAIERLCPRAS
jgi:PAS domain S-box-containing protein